MSSPSSPKYVREVVSKFGSRAGEAVDVVYGESAATAKRVFSLMSPILDGEAVEIFGCLLLNGKYRIIGWAAISRGTVQSTLAHPREFYGPAVRMGAIATIAVHNHPSGDPAPSREDLEVTRRLYRSGVILGIPLLDHVVIGGIRHASIRETNPDLFLQQ